MRRTSATGIRAFTLIEVLVVLAIVGVVIAVVAPNLFPGNIEASRRQGAAVALAIERARDDAWFGGKPTAVSFGDGRLREWRWAVDHWQDDSARGQDGRNHRIALPAGHHRVEVRRLDDRQQRSVEIRPGPAQTLDFKFD